MDILINVDGEIKYCGIKKVTLRKVTFLIIFLWSNYFYSAILSSTCFLGKRKLTDILQVLASGLDDVVGIK